MGCYVTVSTTHEYDTPEDFEDCEAYPRFFSVGFQVALSAV